MIGRRRANNPTSAGNGEADVPEKQAKIKRRVVIAVPDLHSRKPCLKQLFEQILFGRQVESIDEKTTPVLELFARYMVAGWMSWGDEALKYQWEGWWRGGDT